MDAAPVTTVHFSISAFDISLDLDSNHLTRSANDVLTGAQRLCSRWKHAQVQPAHLIHELYAQEASIGAQILQRAGIAQTPIQQLTYRLVAAEPTTNAALGRGVRFSPAFVDVVKQAWVEQRTSGDLLLGVDHLALACCPECCAALAPVKDCGLNRAAVLHAAAQLRLGAEQAKSHLDKRAEPHTATVVMASVAPGMLDDACDLPVAKVVVDSASDSELYDDCDSDDLRDPPSAGMI